MDFMIKFDPEIDEIAHAFSILHHALQYLQPDANLSKESDEYQQSQNFFNFLLVTDRIASFLSGTPDNKGFHIESILKLETTRDRTGKRESLLMHAIREAWTQFVFF